MTLKQSLNEAMKAAMRAQNKQRLGAIRLALAELKRVEVDERIELSDERVISILDKMIKQRRDSVTQFSAGGRQDLVDQENFEIQVLQEFLPAALTATETAQLIQDAMTQAQAKSAQDMGKVMAILKPKLQGRADMGAVSAQVKQELTRISG